MKKKKVTNLAGKSEQELLKEINKLKTDLAKAKLQESVSDTKNTANQGTIRRSIARHMTAMKNQAETNAPTEGQESSK